ncbi:hypothetical protein FOA52_007494 [Chlamydomonas sp. UWO 241]|nr:hypothetical protein FOA52_007494 [Chlamydomonas sp. UWO 241]
MVKGKQNKDKTIRVQSIASFFGGTPGGAVKCIVRRRTGAPTKVVQHPDVDDVEPGLDMRVLLNLVQHGRPMTAFEQEKAVFKGLVDAKVINQDYMSSANWSDDAGWELVSYMARHVAKLELARVRDAAFFAVSGDEATSRDELSYFSLTAYIMVNWERVPTMLDVPRIDDAPNAETLTEMLTKP